MEPFQPITTPNYAPSPPPSFTRTRSQNTLQDQTRHFTAVGGAGLPHHGLSLDGTTPYNTRATSAFATMQKVYQSDDDIGFWSTLYSQHNVHMRQDYQGSHGAVAALGSMSSTTQAPSGHGAIKVWQVLTKSVLDDPNGYSSPQQRQPHSQQTAHRQLPIHFKRLPINVQTSASALSSHGRPVSIVFFFTVEFAPATLWYLESAFTQSATVYEHMELMGTFQPNDPTDPLSFYIYETHAFSIVQPTHEDTMLGIRVQSPAGTVYAEFSYTFLKDVAQGMSSSTSSSLSISPRGVSGSSSSNGSDVARAMGHQNNQEQLRAPSTPAQYKPASPPIQSPRGSYDVVEPDSPGSSYYFQHQLHEPRQFSAEDSNNTFSMDTSSHDHIVSQSSTRTSLPTLVQSHLEYDSGDDEGTDELFDTTNFTEEPDAGEHFKQATSEFFSKMGYWLYNTRFIQQYVARDERNRVKMVFQTQDDIWILGVCYSFEVSELSCSLPEVPRSRKISTLQAQMLVSRSGELKTGAPNSHGPLSENSRDSRRGWERKVANVITSPRFLSDNEAVFTSSTSAEGFESTHGRSRSQERHAEKQREKEQAKAKKAALARERELEREEKAREKVRLKEQEKLQRLKAKISHPHFDKNNIRDGARDLLDIVTSDSKEHSSLHMPLDSGRKSRSAHGYQYEERSDVDLGLTATSGESKQSVIRRMRSISILPKVPTTAFDRLSQKKSGPDLQTGTPSYKTHHSRSQSISNLSIFSQRSAGASSFTSHDGQSSVRPNSPPPSSLKNSIGVHEALAIGPKPTALSKLSHLSLNEKKLPDLPPSSPDDMIYIPHYQYQDEDLDDADDFEDAIYSSPPPVSAIDSADRVPPSPTNSKSSRRRMTMTQIFSKDPKPSSIGGLAVLKTLVNASKASLRPKAEDLAPISRPQSPLGSGVTSTAISFGVQPSTGKEGLSHPKKGSVTKNKQHWFERHLSSNNLPQQVFVAATDEPVPSLPKDVTFSPPGSPLAIKTNGAYDGLQEDRRLYRSLEKEPHLTRFGRTKDATSFTDLVILPPLPPESPTEAFILLDQEPNVSPLSMDGGPEGSVLVSMSGVGSSSPSNAQPSNRLRDSFIDEDPMRLESKRLFEKLAAFSSEKGETVSDLRSEWESLWPSRPDVTQDSTQYTNRGVSDDTADFIHVKKAKESRSAVSHQEDLPKRERERERVRKIGSAYIKIKSPTPDIIAPHPKTLISLQDHAIQAETRQGTAGFDEKPSSTKSHFLKVLTAPPLENSPPSPTSSLNRNWRAKQQSLLVSSSASTSPRSGSAQHGSETTRDDTFVDEKTNLDEDVSHGKNMSSPSGQVSSTQSALDKHRSEVNLSTNQNTLLQFMCDFQTRLWFTYRKDIARIEPSAYTSDAGWGCMMRTGQSLLAQAFVHILLGRGWRAHLPPSEESSQKYHTILGWFADEPDRHYSIHNIARSGQNQDKKVGEWFGPSTVAHALRRLSQRHAECPVTIMVPMDNSIRASDISHAACGTRGGIAATGVDLLEQEKWKPVVLLLPARFGLEKLTERYCVNLKQLYQLPQFLGIAGGRPGRSLYFIACQGNELLYLDPHFVRSRASQEELSSYPAMSYHCSVVRTMDIMEMDPSMMLGFVIQSLSDLADLCVRLKRDMEKGYPLLTILEDIPLMIHEVDQKQEPAVIAPADSRSLAMAPISATNDGEERSVIPGATAPQVAEPVAEKFLPLFLGLGLGQKNAFELELEQGEVFRPSSKQAKQVGYEREEVIDIDYEQKYLARRDPEIHEPKVVLEPNFDQEEVSKEGQEAESVTETSLNHEQLITASLQQEDTRKSAVDREDVLRLSTMQGKIAEGDLEPAMIIKTPFEQVEVDFIPMQEDVFQLSSWQKEVMEASLVRIETVEPLQQEEAATDILELEEVPELRLEYQHAVSLSAVQEVVEARINQAETVEPLYEQEEVVAENSELEEVPKPSPEKQDIFAPGLEQEEVVEVGQENANAAQTLFEREEISQENYELEVVFDLTLGQQEVGAERHELEGSFKLTVDPEAVFSARQEEVLQANLEQVEILKSILEQGEVAPESFGVFKSSSEHEEVFSLSANQPEVVVVEADLEQVETVDPLNEQELVPLEILGDDKALEPSPKQQEVFALRAEQGKGVVEADPEQLETAEPHHEQEAAVRKSLELEEILERRSGHQGTFVLHTEQQEVVEADVEQVETVDPLYKQEYVAGASFEQVKTVQSPLGHGDITAERLVMEEMLERSPKQQEVLTLSAKETVLDSGLEQAEIVKPLYEQDELAADTLELEDVPGPSPRQQNVFAVSAQQQETVLNSCLEQMEIVESVHEQHFASDILEQDEVPEPSSSEQGAVLDFSLEEMMEPLLEQEKITVDTLGQDDMPGPSPNEQGAVLDSSLEEMIEPLLEQGMIEPLHEQEMIEPLHEQEMIEPLHEQEMIEPLHEQEMIEPLHEQEKIEPLLEQEKIEPLLEQEKIEPLLEQEKIEPLLEQEKIEPLLEQEKIEPLLEQEKIEPLLEQENIEPPLEQENIEPPLEQEKIAVDTLEQEEVPEPYPNGQGAVMDSGLEEKIEPLLEQEKITVDILEQEEVPGPSLNEQGAVLDSGVEEMIKPRLEQEKITIDILEQEEAPGPYSDQQETVEDSGLEHIKIVESLLEQDEVAIDILELEEAPEQCPNQHETVLDSDLGQMEIVEPLLAQDEEAVDILELEEVPEQCPNQHETGLDSILEQMEIVEPFLEQNEVAVDVFELEEELSAELQGRFALDAELQKEEMEAGLKQAETDKPLFKQEVAVDSLEIEKTLESGPRQQDSFKLSAELQEDVIVEEAGHELMESVELPLEQERVPVEILLQEGILEPTFEPQDTFKLSSEQEEVLEASPEHAEIVEPLCEQEEVTPGNHVPEYILQVSLDQEKLAAERHDSEAPLEPALEQEDVLKLPTEQEKTVETSLGQTEIVGSSYEQEIGSGNLELEEIIVPSSEHQQVFEVGAWQEEVVDPSFGQSEVIEPFLAQGDFAADILQQDEGSGFTFEQEDTLSAAQGQVVEASFEEAVIVKVLFGQGEVVADISQKKALEEIYVQQMLALGAEQREEAVLAEADLEHRDMVEPLLVLEKMPEPELTPGVLGLETDASLTILPIVGRPESGQVVELDVTTEPHYELETSAEQISPLIADLISRPVAPQDFEQDFEQRYTPVVDQSTSRNPKYASSAISSQDSRLVIEQKDELMAWQTVEQDAEEVTDAPYCAAKIFAGQEAVQMSEKELIVAEVAEVEEPAANVANEHAEQRLVSEANKPVQPIMDGLNQYTMGTDQMESDFHVLTTTTDDLGAALTALQGQVQSGQNKAMSGGQDETLVDEQDLIQFDLMAAATITNNAHDNIAGANTSALIIQPQRKEEGESPPRPTRQSKRNKSRKRKHKANA